MHACMYEYTRYAIICAQRYSHDTSYEQKQLVVRPSPSLSVPDFQIELLPSPPTPPSTDSNPRDTNRPAATSVEQKQILPATAGGVTTNTGVLLMCC